MRKPDSRTAEVCEPQTVIAEVVRLASTRPPAEAAYFSSVVRLLEWPLPQRVSSELFCAENHLSGRPEFEDNVYASG